MFIDLSEIKKSPFAFEFSIASAEIDLESDTARLNNTVEIRGELTKRIAQVDLEGEIVADLEMDCTRCLQPKVDKLNIPYSVTYITPELYTEEKEAELSEEDLQVSIFDGSQIDVKELVREQILLGLPEQNFCREDCKGLCQQCGADRNLIDCKCDEKEIDPRWAALKNLK
jgi:uncharacterized protein